MGTDRDDPHLLPGSMVGYYDIFVDWPGRLSREMPALASRLAALGAQRILDVGCGTGHHVRALTEAGFDTIGADPDPGMLDQAREVAGDRFVRWGLGSEPPPELADAPPFDAVICLGNVWPRFGGGEVARCAADLLGRLRSGGALIVGLKAFGVQIAEGRLHLPLLRREHEGRVFHFVRFLDATVPPEDDGFSRCDMHMVVAIGDGVDEAPVATHGTTRLRAWTPATLEACFTAAGFGEVRVSSSIGDPEAPPKTEDVFVHARRPA
jgi:SAM-dependent methyltransferase